MCHVSVLSDIVTTSFHDDKTAINPSMSDFHHERRCAGCPLVPGGDQWRLSYLFVGPVTLLGHGGG